MQRLIKAPKENENKTPEIVRAVAELSDGDVLTFEKGTYVLAPEGASEGFFAPSNNGVGNKQVVFPLIGKKNVTVDGGGSVFVFSGNAFPFILQNCENVTLENIFCTADVPQYIGFKIEKKTDEGFYISIDKETYPYSTENGKFIINFAGKTMRAAPFSFHSCERCCIRYIFAGEPDANRAGLAAPYTDTVARELKPGLVYFEYTDTSGGEKLAFGEGERIAINSAGRNKDVVFIEDCRNVKISSFRIERGTGMGMIAQRTENIEITGYTVKAREGETVSTSADALHFVNCSGKITVRDSFISDSMDDAINSHGNYTVFESLEGNVLHVRNGHREQNFFTPCKKGDKIRFIDPQTLEIVNASAKVVSAVFTDKAGLATDLEIEDLTGKENLRAGLLIENYEKMPEIEFVGNTCVGIPHLRLSGNKRIRVAHNRFERCIGILGYDLFNYWYESGRIGELIIENNVFDHMNYPPMSGNSAISVGVPGFPPDKTPYIHGKVVIKNNEFISPRNFAFTVSGVKEFISEGNTLDGSPLEKEKFIIYAESVK